MYIHIHIYDNIFVLRIDIHYHRSLPSSCHKVDRRTEILHHPGCTKICK